VLALLAIAAAFWLTATFWTRRKESSAGSNHVPDDSHPSDDFRPAVLTPSACLEAVAARLDQLHQGAAGMLRRAVPVGTGGTGKVSSGFLYAGVKATLPTSFRAWMSLCLEQPQQVGGF
jgi:hypothetical protein